MKNLIVISAVIASVVGCAGYQSRLDDAQTKARDLKEKVVCRAKVIGPYVAYALEADLPALLDGADIADLMAVSGAVDAEVAEVKAAFAACGKIELK